MRSAGGTGANWQVQVRFMWCQIIQKDHLCTALNKGPFYI